MRSVGVEECLSRKCLPIEEEVRPRVDVSAVVLIDLLADKHRLDGFVNFLTQIIDHRKISLRILPYSKNATASSRLFSGPHFLILTFICNKVSLYNVTQFVQKF